MCIKMVSFIAISNLKTLFSKRLDMPDWQISVLLKSKPHAACLLSLNLAAHLGIWRLKFSVKCLTLSLRIFSLLVLSYTNSWWAKDLTTVLTEKKSDKISSTTRWQSSSMSFQKAWAKVQFPLSTVSYREIKSKDSAIQALSKSSPTNGSKTSTGKLWRESKSSLLLSLMLYAKQKNISTKLYFTIRWKQTMKIHSPNYPHWTNKNSQTITSRK